MTELGQIKFDSDTFRDLDQLIRIMKVLFEHSFESVILTSPETDRHGILFANPAFCKMTGYEESELLGKSPKILQGPKTNRKVMQNLRQCLTDATPFHGAAMNYRKDGNIYHVEWKINGIYDDEGKLLAYFSVQRDLTYLKKFLSKVKQSTDTFRSFVKKVREVNNNTDTDIELQQSLEKVTKQQVNDMAMFSPSLRNEDDTELFDDELFLFDEDTSGVMPVEEPTNNITAAEYFQSIELEPDDIANLCSLLTECMSGVEILRSTEEQASVMRHLISDIEEFANLLFFMDEFVDISTVLGELSRSLQKVDHDNVPNFVIDTLGAMVLDLKEWIDTILIHQTSLNIHEHDASIIGSAKQLIVMIK